MNTESWMAVLVVLAAVLVGAAIPALVQLRATLRAAEQAFRRTGTGLDEALGATAAAARRFDGLVTRLEAGGRIEQLLDGLASTTRALGHLRDGLKVASAVGAAVGPAVAAAVHVFREDRQAPPATPLRVAATDSDAVPPQAAGKQATP